MGWALLLELKASSLCRFVDIVYFPKCITWPCLQLYSLQPVSLEEMAMQDADGNELDISGDENESSGRGKRPRDDLVEVDAQLLCLYDC